MPNTKVGPKVAIPPAKSSAAAAAPAPAASQSPAKPVKSPVKKAAITRVTAGPPHSPSPLQHFTFIRLPLSQLPTPCLTILTLKCRRPRGKVCCRCERGNQGAARGKQVPHARHPVEVSFTRPKPLIHVQAEEQRRAAQRPRLPHHVNSLPLLSSQALSPELHEAQQRASSCRQHLLPPPTDRCTRSPATPALHPFPKHQAYRR